MIGIELFSGAGGMSLGARRAGINVLAAIEIDENSAATFSLNHPEVTIYNSDVRGFDFKPLKQRLPNDSNEQVIIFGGPPCQGYSYSNSRTRSTENPKNWLFLELLRAVEELYPHWVCVENVRGIANTASGVFVDQLGAKLQAMGYTIRSALLDACDFGVPQRRVRYFLVANRCGCSFSFPPATAHTCVTVRDAVADLPPLENGAGINRLPYRSAPHSSYARLMRSGREWSLNHLVTRNSRIVIDRYSHIPQGGNWEDIPLHLLANYSDPSRCHTGIYRRLAYNKPSVVIGNYRKNMLIHPTQNRGLSVREAARIQSFPDDYVFLGRLGHQQQQVGDAVPPLLAEAVFRAIVEPWNPPKIED